MKNDINHEKKKGLSLTNDYHLRSLQRKIKQQNKTKKKAYIYIAWFRLTKKLLNT